MMQSIETQKTAFGIISKGGFFVYYFGQKQLKNRFKFNPRMGYIAIFNIPIYQLVTFFRGRFLSTKCPFVFFF